VTPTEGALSQGLDWSTRARFHYHTLRRALSNLALLRHRRFDGFIASMHQSGTHWLKYMLASAIAEQWRLPPPRYNHANDIIGGPRDPRLYPHAPALGSSHSIPHPLARVRWLRAALALPKYVVLVRDPRAALASNYEKWHEAYGVTFRKFLEGDVRGRRYNSDLWWCIRFLNAWGAVARRVPEATLIVRYEDLLADPGQQLARIDSFLSLGLSARAMRAGIAAATRERMQARHDPGRPAGEVADRGRVIGDWFGPEEERYLQAVCRCCLAYRFGYDLDCARAADS
jgi:hypothetical protein